MLIALLSAPNELAARTGLFAQGRFLGRVVDEWVVDTQEFIRLKLPHLVVLLGIALLLGWLLRTITTHMVRVAEQHGSGAFRLSQVRTLSGVIRATGMAVIGLITGLGFLAAVGLNLAPLLASAGVAGIAIGLAAQNTVKDILNGIFFLVEDQFNVGDTVHLAGAVGVVEAMTLRKTSVRDADGTLWIIPNSQITTVANLSAQFSVATVNVSVDVSAEPDAVVKLLKTIALEVRSSDPYRSVFLDDPQVLGVDQVKGSEMIYPVVFKTLATKQYEPVREFRRRVRQALEQRNLLPGDPNRIFKGFASDQDQHTDATLQIEAMPHAEATPKATP